LLSRFETRDTELALARLGDRFDVDGDQAHPVPVVP
jgi:hypothetical protein